MIRPNVKRRIIRREYDMAEVLIRKLFSIPKDEMIKDLLYDKPNSTLILTTLKDHDKLKGDL